MGLFEHFKKKKLSVECNETREKIDEFLNGNIDSAWDWFKKHSMKEFNDLNVESECFEDSEWFEKLSMMKNTARAANEFVFVCTNVTSHLAEMLERRFVDDDKYYDMINQNDPYDYVVNYFEKKRTSRPAFPYENEMLRRLYDSCDKKFNTSGVFYEVLRAMRSGKILPESARDTVEAIQIAVNEMENILSGRDLTGLQIILDTNSPEETLDYFGRALGKDVSREIINEYGGIIEGWQRFKELYVSVKEKASAATTNCTEVKTLIEKIMNGAYDDSVVEKLEIFEHCTQCLEDVVEKCKFVVGDEQATSVLQSAMKEVIGARISSIETAMAFHEALKNGVYDEELVRYVESGRDFIDVVIDVGKEKGKISNEPLARAVIQHFTRTNGDAVAEFNEYKDALERGLIMPESAKKIQEAMKKVMSMIKNPFNLSQVLYKYAREFDDPRDFLAAFMRDRGFDNVSPNEVYEWYDKIPEFREFEHLWNALKKEVESVLSEANENFLNYVQGDSKWVSMVDNATSMIDEAESIVRSCDAEQYPKIGEIVREVIETYDALGRPSENLIYAFKDDKLGKIRRFVRSIESSDNFWETASATGLQKFYEACRYYEEAINMVGGDLRYYVDALRRRDTEASENVGNVYENLMLFKKIFPRSDGTIIVGDGRVTISYACAFEKRYGVDIVEVFQLIEELGRMI